MKKIQDNFGLVNFLNISWNQKKTRSYDIQFVKFKFKFSLIQIIKQCSYFRIFNAVDT